MAAAMPDITVEVSFSSRPTAEPSWTDISSAVKAIPQITRGRQTVLDRFQAGTATVLVDNRDRDFDPTYASGSYYPNVVPMRRIRIRATFSSTTYDLFNGYVVDWPQQYPGPREAVVPIQCADGFKVLALDKLSQSYSQEASGTRINNVLSDVSWLTADRDIDAGQSTIQAVTLDNEEALSHLLTINETENGRLFINGAGEVVFQDRHAKYKSPYDTVQATFGSGSGELPFDDIALEYSDMNIWNHTIVERSGGTAQSVEDSDSIDDHFRRTLEKTGLLMTSDTEAQDAANWLLSQFKSPRLRIRELVLQGRYSDDVATQALTREIGDRVKVVHRPPGGGTITQESFIEQITWAFRKGAWTVRWALSRASDQAFWILNSSALGTDTRLAY